MLRDPMVHRLGAKLIESSLRQRVIAHNIANSETPRFKAFQLAFDNTPGESGLSTGLSLTRTHSAHLPGHDFDALAAAAGARLVRDTSTTMRNDGNNVDLDRELADLAANQLYSASITTMLAKRFDGYARIIAGRAG